METHLAPEFANTANGHEAEAILRSCVHCGFCNATCPTYRLLGDELDGPRGRIYLMKQMLEGVPVSAHTLTHLDRCLTCRNCETTCPSGVQYGRLLDIGREIAEQRVRRPLGERLKRQAIRHGLSHGARFALGLGLGRGLKPLLPATLAGKIPVTARVKPWPAPRHARRMLVLEGCVQPALAPGINLAAARVLDALGISLLRASGTGCCGALPQHLAAPGQAKVFMRRNIDAWWPRLEAGVEAIVITASGCGVQVKDYGHYLRDDAAYAARAERVSALARDIAEVIAPELDSPHALRLAPRSRARIAFQCPCTLQHGQKLPGLVENILARLGFELIPTRDAHLCCGSAGAYSLLQPGIANTLRDAKLAALGEYDPELIASANIGCITHLASGAGVPVRHWIELLDGEMQPPTPTR